MISFYKCEGYPKTLDEKIMNEIADFNGKIDCTCCDDGKIINLSSLHHFCDECGHEYDKRMFEKVNNQWRFKK